jgi:transposase
MNIHQDVRLGFIRRVELLEDVIQRGLPASQVAHLRGVSAATVGNWVGRLLAEGLVALVNR